MTTTLSGLLRLVPWLHRRGERAYLAQLAFTAAFYAERKRMQMATDHLPTHVYMHPDDAAGLVAVAGLTVRTCPDLPRGKVVLSYETEGA